MAKYVLSARKIGSTKVRYFHSYRDDGDFGKAVWDDYINNARLFSALEIETEKLLLSEQCPQFLIDMFRLDDAKN